MNRLWNILVKQADTAVYGFVGPFGVLYIFPQFFRGLDEKLHLNLPTGAVQNYIGSTLMWLGVLLALWCWFLMLRNRGTVNAFSRPAKLVTISPYQVVRHPMMWSLHIVLIGEMIVWASPMVAVWFLIWLRFAALYIQQYEEPRLHRLFGNAYAVYCRDTPRWLPFLSVSQRREKVNSPL